MNRLYNSTCSAESKPKLAPYWNSKEGRPKLLAYAVDLAREEYREGFIFSGRLGCGIEHVVSEETVTWFPASLGKLLAKRCRKKTALIPFGVGTIGDYYFWRSLDGTNRTGRDPYALHRAFVKERRDLLLSWTERDVGPRTRALLLARVARIDEALDKGLEVDHI